MKTREKNVAYIYVTKTSSLSSSMDFHFSLGKETKNIIFYKEDYEGNRREEMINKIAETVLSLVDSKEGRCKFVFNHELSWEMDVNAGKLNPHTTYRKEFISAEERSMIWEALWL